MADDEIFLCDGVGIVFSYLVVLWQFYDSSMVTNDEIFLCERESVHVRKLFFGTFLDIFLHFEVNTDKMFSTE